MTKEITSAGDLTPKKRSGREGENVPSDLVTASLLVTVTPGH
jgi:hypothetical protein